MDDMISRAAAIDAIVSATVFPDADYIKNLCQNPANSEDWLGGVCDAINAVEEVAAVAAAPVVHGHWKSVKANASNNYPFWDSKCSACGYTTAMTQTGWQYCPHCGANMDGRESE